MPKITELYAWVVSDKSPDDEGVPAVDGNLVAGMNMALPLMGADAERAKSLRHFAKLVANRKKGPVKLLKSTGIEVVDTVYPDE